MHSDIPSLTPILEARRRASDIVATRTPDAAVEELRALDVQLEYPARGEVWDALARVGTAFAGAALLAIAAPLTDKAQQKRLRTLIHGLRSRGVPVEMPSGAKGGTFAPVPQPPPLRTWASCVDGAGAYTLLAHLHRPSEGIGALACFAVTRGARDFSVFKVGHPREIDEVLEKFDEDVEGGMPPLHPVDPDAWMDLADRGMREHREGGFADPEDIENWQEIMKGVAAVLSPRFGPHEPAGSQPHDIEAACAGLIGSEDYASWYFDQDDLGAEIVDRCRAFLELPPGKARDAAWTILEADMLAAISTEELAGQWRRGLRHNARVHAAALDPGTASLEAGLADLLDRVPFREHPLVREAVRLTPDRLFPLDEEAGKDPDSPDARWRERGWQALEEFEGRRRRSVEEYFLDLWMIDQPEAKRDGEAVLKRLWGKDAREFVADSGMGTAGLIPGVVHFHLWDYRRTHRSKTVAETLVGRIGEVPPQVQPIWRGRMTAVTSLYQVVRVPGEGLLEVEDALSDARMVVESPIVAGPSMEGAYPLIIGKVFPVGATNWLSPAGPFLSARMKLPMIASIAAQLGLYGSRRPTVDQLRAHPEGIWRALRAAEERIRERADAMRETLERARESRGTAPADPPPREFADLPEAAKLELRRQLHAIQERHCAAWPDMEIPALEYRTPRKAVKDPQYRRIVVDLIREMEAMSRQDPIGVDLTAAFAKLRRELGIVE